MRVLNSEEILSAFPKKDRKNVKLPRNLEKIDWDNLDFLGWLHSSGHLAYMIFEWNGALEGLVLEKSLAAKRNISKMCSLCKTISGSQGIVLFSSTLRKNKKVSRAVYVCSDLQCSLRVRGKIALGANQMCETISTDDKIIRLLDGVEEFYLSIC